MWYTLFLVCRAIMKLWELLQLDDSSQNKPPARLRSSAMSILLWNGREDDLLRTIIHQKLRLNGTKNRRNLWAYVSTRDRVCCLPPCVSSISMKTQWWRHWLPPAEIKQKLICIIPRSLKIPPTRLDSHAFGEFSNSRADMLAMAGFYDVDESFP